MKNVTELNEVGELLRQSGVPVVEFRASIGLGSGSLWFEMVRALVDRLPVMVMPRWVLTLTQPIVVEDLVAYLLAAIELEGRQSRLGEFGGSDQRSYPPWCRTRQRWRCFPCGSWGVREAIAGALRHEDRTYAETRWSDALSVAGGRPSWGGVRFGTRLVDSRVAQTKSPPAQTFRPIRQIGGQRGWYYANWLWRFRGLIDPLVGGAGLRRGRRDPDWLVPGDTLDFWRVEVFETDRWLRLTAEMKLPGRAWLEFEVEGDARSSRIRQTAIFDPVGLWGQLSWYALHPLHGLIFAGMLRGLVRAGEQEPAPKPVTQA